MPDERRPTNPPRRKRRKRKRWTWKRLRFELTRIAVLLAFLLIIVLLVKGCKAAVSAIRGTPEEPPAQTEEQTPEAPTEAPAPEPESRQLKLVMVGDVLLHTPIQDSGRQEDGSYNYDHLFAHVKDQIEGADLALVNQEVILGGRELGLSGYPTFNGPFEVGDALVNAGFDVVCHATNHALDKGAQGITGCLNFWETSHPDTTVLGIHDSQESYDSMTVLEQNGMKIAILNYTYGTNGIVLPEPYMVDLLDEDKVTADLARAEAEADFTIVAPHWGTEYTHTPSAQQEHWNEIFLAGGADLVLGTHPHVIQPIEWLEDESGHKMLVYYSLGNFINFTSDSGSGVGQRAVGAMAQVTLTRSDGEVTISDYGVTPLISHMVEGTGKPTTYPLSDYTEELLKENEMSRKDPDFTLDYCRDLCSQVFGETYKP